MKKKILKIALSFACLLVILIAVFWAIDFSHKVKPSSSLINKNASPNAIKLYDYLLSIYGSKMISGQYINAHDDYSKTEYLDDSGNSDVRKAKEMEAIYGITGKYPALLGTDILGGEQLVDQCIQWDSLGGIVTLCWHWQAPGYQRRGESPAFYTRDTSFNLREALKNKNGDDYKDLIKDIDAAAVILKKLADKDIPVLFRPLHEASGGWFWWGAFGPKAYLELWDILYERLTNFHQLNNLIWIFNGQSFFWYVGDDKCDMVAWDAYPFEITYENDRNYERRFKNLLWSTTNKMASMSENSYIPMGKKKNWLFFCTWCREFVCETFRDDQNYLRYSSTYNEKYNSASELLDIYNQDDVITLDEINWKSFVF